MTCDWCDAEATYEDRGARAIPAMMVACDAHRDELGSIVFARAMASGNRWTGDAIEGAVRPL